MVHLYAQGDILVERIDAVPVSGQIFASVIDGSLVIAAGEATGHHHRILGSVTMFRDDALARDVPRKLYVGHLQVTSPMSRLEHEEHAPIALTQGCYRVRRQRHLEPADLGMFEEWSGMEY